jgi:hypothetical protein
LFSILTKLSKDYTQTIRFEIEPKQIPEDKLILKDSLHYLDITLTTYGFKHVRYFLAKPKIIIQIGNLDKDDKQFFWTREKGLSHIISQFDPNVIVDAINPDTIRFKYDQSYVKMIPIKLDSDIQFETGYSNIDQITIEPDSVKAIGPKSLIDSISSIDTNTLKIENVKNDISEKVDLKLATAQNQIRYSHKSIIVNGKVDKFTEGSVDVPVLVKNIPKDIKLNYYPKVVSVVYYTSLSNFKNITNSSFIVSCDYNNIVDGNSFLVPQILDIPEGVKGVKLGTNKIEIIIVQ